MLYLMHNVSEFRPVAINTRQMHCIHFCEICTYNLMKKIYIELRKPYAYVTSWLNYFLTWIWIWVDVVSNITLETTIFFFVTCFQIHTFKLLHVLLLLLLNHVICRMNSNKHVVHQHHHGAIPNLTYAGHPRDPIRNRFIDG